MGPVHPAASAQEKGRPGALLQRPDHRAGEEVRHAEVPVASGEEAAGQDAAAQWEAGGQTDAAAAAAVTLTQCSGGTYRYSISKSFPNKGKKNKIKQKICVDVQ